MEKNTIYILYSIFAYYPSVDKAYTFYFKDKHTAEQAREIISICNEQIDVNSKYYCSSITIPCQKIVDVDDIYHYQIFENIKDFINNPKFNKIYGNIYSNSSHEL